MHLSGSALAGLALGLAAVAAAAAPPWTPQYKLKPHEKHRLTPADVVGPDGIVYPNWTRVGVQGGIPQVVEAARIEDFGARPDDDADDAQALDRACRAVGRKGGGAVVLGPGVYHLDRPVTVRHDGVVIRGQGAEATRLVFRYALPEEGIAIYWPPPGSRVGPATPLEMHCRPGGLRAMTLLVDETPIGRWARGRHSGNTFSFARRGSHAVGQVADGEHTLRAVAEYGGGAKLEAAIPIVVDSAWEDPRQPPSSRAAITFEGPGWSGPRLRLAEDGKRGSHALVLASSGDLRPGDGLVIDAPATERWKKLTRNRCPWGAYRRYEAVVERVEGREVRLGQPLRIDFPVADGAWVQKVLPRRRCGIEALSIEQTENLWITTVLFHHGWNCWASGVRVRMCGRFPVYGHMAKWCTIRECVFDDAWFKGGGGTAYAGWQHSYDCLMERCETFRLRHAPLVQWSASGNVVRQCVFHESDGQWHAGWTNENLFEQCVIESTRGHGGYGYGLWASPPEDRAHGPNGPRNVVYNCDVRSPKTGVWMGGMNEAWLILYSRFVVGRGPGVFAKTASFDHIIRGNAFVLRDGKSPMVRLATADCTGVEVVGNRLYGGNGTFVAGQAEAAVLEGNQALPLGEAPRSQPPVPSIYEWQNRER
ncbi:MAG: right-handed parallel beta-helix repeat-containing protein [Candidatus Brocadiia bacterium]